MTRIGTNKGLCASRGQGGKLRRGRTPFLVAAGALAALAAASCHLVTGAGDFHVGDGAGAGASGNAGAGASGAGGAAGGAGAGGGADCVPSECPRQDTECATRICNPDGSCGMQLAEKGTECAAGICDGDGYCVDPSCLDGEWSTGETDVDCGGPSCGPCGKGKLRKVAGDCQSGFCADEVCCESACDGVCEACVESKTGKADGLCAIVTGGTDPDDECGSAEKCDGEMCSGTAGSCEPASAQTVCRSAADLCDADDYCDGASTGCPADVPASAGTDCRPAVDGCDAAETCDGVLPRRSDTCRTSIRSFGVASTGTRHPRTPRRRPPLNHT